MSLTVKKHIEHIRVSPLSEKIYTSLFGATLLFAIGVRIYKAHYSGIMYDESMTFNNYCRDVHTAITSFTSTNNHILNSVFICFAHKLLGSYEHFIRIPSVSASILFTFALAYIICKTIDSWPLRIVSLALILLGQYVYHYSFLARGYAFALAGIYLQIAFVIYLLEHKIQHRYWLAPVLIISMMNFLAFGAMLSSILFLFAFNLTYIVFYSPKVFRNTTGKIKTIVLSLVSTFMVTFIAVFSLYRHIYREISQNKIYRGIARDWQGWPSFVDCLKGIFGDWIFQANTTLGIIILWAALGLIIVGLIYNLYRFHLRLKLGVWKKYMNQNEPELLIFIVTGLTIVIMFIYGVVLNKSLGLLRNHVFLIPVMVICSFIIMDRLVRSVRKKIPGYALRTTIVILALAITWRNLPASYSLCEDGISGPLLHRLKTIDPDKNWNIAFSQEKALRFMGFLYYRQFGYRFNIVRGGNFDVLICSTQEKKPRALCLDRDFFSKADTAVVINCPLPENKVHLSAELRDNRF